MSLVIKDRNEISVLLKKLNNCMNCNQFVNIHINISNVIVHNSIILDEIIVEKESITVNSKSFSFCINNLENIEYEEEFESFCLYVSNGEIYFDFME